MSKNSNRLSVVNGYSATNYLPAVLKEYKSGWIIEYYVENPSTQELSRKKIRLQRLTQRYKSKSELRKHVNNIILALNLKLSTGWNPYFVGEDSRLYTPVKDVIEQYKEEIKRNVRPDTHRSYCSFVNIFLEWVEGISPGIYSSMITHAYVAKFMDYVYNERKGMKNGCMSNRTYNNYVKLGSAFFTWMIDKCYCKENHFSKIKTKKAEDKTRILIPEEDRIRIADYLQNKNPGYLLVIKLIFNSLLRPKEIRNLKVSDILLDQKQIVVRKDVAKNGKERIVPMTPDVEKEFLKYNLHRYSPNFYVFGKHFTPNEAKASDSLMQKHWEKMRKELNLPKEMQQYSLRDTGITELLQSGVTPLSVKQFADHHSLEMTTIYSNHANPHLQEIIYNNSPEFAKKNNKKNLLTTPQPPLQTLSPQ